MADSLKQKMSVFTKTYISERDIDDAEKEKLYIAERRVAGLRLINILFNVFVYYFFFPRSESVLWASYVTIFGVFSYALIVYLYEPYKKYKILLSSYFTVFGDAIFISIWIYATGGFDSPWYVLWYLSIVAVVFRYTYEKVFTATIIYTLSYLATVSALGQFVGHEMEILVRVGYMFFVAILGSMLGAEFYKQTDDKLKIKKLADNLESAKDKLALEKAEDEALIESLGEGVIAVDTLWRIRKINTQAQRMIGWKAAEVVDKPLFQFLPWEDKNGKRFSLEEYPVRVAINSGEKIHDKYGFIKKDGTKILVDVSVAPVILNKQRTGAIMTFHELS